MRSHDPPFPTTAAPRRPSVECVHGHRQHLAAQRARRRTSHSRMWWTAYLLLRAMERSHVLRISPAVCLILPPFRHRSSACLHSTSTAISRTIMSAPRTLGRRWWPRRLRCRRPCSTIASGANAFCGRSSWPWSSCCASDTHSSPPSPHGAYAPQTRARPYLHTAATGIPGRIVALDLQSPSHHCHAKICPHLY